MESTTFTAQFDRDHVHMTVEIGGRFTAADLEQFRADVETASRGRRREWTVDASALEDGSEAMVEVLVWLRTLGHVCLLNPPSDLQRALEAADVHQAIVVRSDSRVEP